MERTVFTRQDQKFTQLYKDFLPEKIIDAHMHLWRADLIPRFYKPGGVFDLKEAGPENYEVDMRAMLPGVREIGLVMMIMPDPLLADRREDFRSQSTVYMAAQAAKAPDRYRAVPYILPEDTEEEIEQQLKLCGGCGLKVYGYGTGKWDINPLDIAEFLPEAAWVVAERREIPIILHILKDALSDPENYAYITRMTEKYPQAPLVLAHCARSFEAWTGIPRIRDLADHGNIWFDLSAICEPGPMMACILKSAGSRVMWGSDYPNSLYRGRAVSLGLGQNWLLDLEAPGKAYVGQENLMAFYQAAILLDLDRKTIEDIFYNNAARLYFGKT